MSHLRSHFSQAVSVVVRDILPGHTLSYREVALLAGFPGAARAVGSLMKKNKRLEIPCHRVVCQGGRVGAYNRGGEQAKARLLRAEGVAIQERLVAGERSWFLL